MRNLDKLEPFLNDYEQGYIIYKDGALYRTSRLHAGRNSNGRWETRVPLKEPALMRMKLGVSKYHRVKTRGETAYEHVVIYAIHHGIESLERWEHIDHLDNNRLNNRIENLEGVTVEENNRRIIEDNLLRPRYGEDNGESRLKEHEVLEIRRLYECGHYTQYELGDKFNVLQPHISDIVNRKAWTHI